MKCSIVYVPVRSQISDLGCAVNALCLTYVHGAIENITCIYTLYICVFRWGGGGFGPEGVWTAEGRGRIT